MEARFEENNREISAKMAQFEQWRTEMSAKQQSLETALSSLRLEIGVCLRAQNEQTRADLAQLHQGVSQVACMLMAKIPPRDHHVLQEQGAVLSKASEPFSAVSVSAVRPGANTAMANIEAKTPGQNVINAQPSLLTPLVCLEQPQPVVLGRPLPKDR